MSVVEFQDVGVQISGRQILTGLTFAVEPGETLILLGRSGSGKSTALKLTNGMLLPSSGKVLVDGQSTTDWDPIKLKRRIGYVIQDVGLFPHFTVARNVALIPKLEGWPREKIEARVHALLDAVSIPASTYSERYPRQLSGGQRQRVGIARALAADPSLLLFDEPFGALDPVTRFELQQQFLTWQRDLKKTALFVTHDIREALKLGSRIVLLEGGKIDSITTPRDFLQLQSQEAQAFLKTQ